MDKVLSATIEGESPNSSVAEQKKLSVMSGIFSFFFSRSRPTFSEDDVLFFLQMANDHCIGHFSFGIFRLFLLKVLEMRDNEITGSDVKVRFVTIYVLAIVILCVLLLLVRM